MYLHDRTGLRRKEFKYVFNNEYLGVLDRDIDGKIEMYEQNECSQLVNALKAQCPYAGVKITASNSSQNIGISFPIEAVESIVQKQKEDEENFKVIIKTKRHDVVEKFAEKIAAASNYVSVFHPYYITNYGLAKTIDEWNDQYILSFESLGLKPITSKNSLISFAEAVADYLREVNDLNYDLSINGEDDCSILLREHVEVKPRPVLSDW